MANPMTFLYNGNGSLAFQDTGVGGTLTGSGAVRYQAAENARTNLILNPRAATGTTGWQGFSTTVTRVADGDFFGGYCINADTSNSSGLLYCRYTNCANVVSGALTFSYSFKAKLVSGTASEWTFKLVAYDCAGNIVQNPSTIAFGLSTTATTFSGTWTFTSAAVGLHRIEVIFAHTTTNNCVIRVSEMCIQEGSVSDKSYFDGSTGGVWLDPITGILGTANASPSVSQAVPWAEEGTTNAIPDPSFENATITNYWTAQGAATISKVTTFAYIGSNGGNVLCTASTADGIHQLATSGQAASNGQTWTLSGRIRAKAAADVGDVVQPAIIERDAADAVVATNLGTAITLTDAWQRFSYVKVLAGGGTVAKVTMGMMNGAAVACEWVIDALQLENKAYKTSYCDGAIGTGYAWSGTAHASSSTRTATVISVPHANLISADRGAFVARACPLYYPTTIGGNSLFIAGDYYTTTVRSYSAWIDASRRVKFDTREPNGSVESMLTTGALSAYGSWSSVYLGWDGTVKTVSISNAALETGSKTTAAANAMGATNLSIGSSFLNIDGGVGPVAIFSRPLTVAERSRLLNASIWNWGILGARFRHGFIF